MNHMAYSHMRVPTGVKKNLRGTYQHLWYCLSHAVEAGEENAEAHKVNSKGDVYVLLQ